MITYNWNCKTVDAYPQDGAYTDLVYNVHYIVSGQDEIGNAATNIGTQSLDVSDVTEFIPFEDLTNEIVVGWTKGAMGEEQVASIETSIASQIEQIIKPTTVTLTIGEPVPPVE
jgi:hypothetical protein|tara:strand:- start:41 stop:382 length:342 start_codon:yes stop_codon:yes gene_type:complete